VIHPTLPKVDLPWITEGDKPWKLWYNNDLSIKVPGTLFMYPNMQMGKLMNAQEMLPQSSHGRMAHFQTARAQGKSLSKLQPYFNIF